MMIETTLALVLVVSLVLHIFIRNIAAVAALTSFACTLIVFGYEILLTGSFAVGPDVIFWIPMVAVPAFCVSLIIGLPFAVVRLLFPEQLRRLLNDSQNPTSDDSTS